MIHRCVRKSHCFVPLNKCHSNKSNNVKVLEFEKFKTTENEEAIADKYSFIMKQMWLENTCETARPKLRLQGHGEGTKI